MDTESGVRERRKVTTTAETPPANDDCCPICFSDFTFPCRTDCNHWFCASCILEFWHYGAVLRPCKCPLCSRNISRLTPEASLHHSQELKAAEALKNIQQYNRLFVGGTHGLRLRICDLPLLIKRLLRNMMDPDNFYFYFRVVRCIAMLVGIHCSLSRFNLISTGGIYEPKLFRLCSLILLLILQLVGYYRRRHLLHRERQLAGPHP